MMDNVIINIHHFDLTKVVEIILKYQFRHITLQFPDEIVYLSIEIYQALISTIKNEDYHFFIVTDSTFGSSIDDVSCMHVDSDVIVYFGFDLSSSSSIPVILLQPNLDIDISSLNNHLKNFSNLDLLILYEPCYFKSLYANKHVLEIKDTSYWAKLPIIADLNEWNPIDATTFDKLENVRIGGLLVDKLFLEEKDYTVFYIGVQTTQLQSILLDLSLKEIIRYNPCVSEAQDCLQHLKGCELREFRERFGGVSKVEDSNVIGIIVGSMGLEENLTKQVIVRLETLIHAAKKKSIVLVIGRLTEAKLCNFPEVDIFCLLANNDASCIRPKTFQVPVLTPWELELGLKARMWESTYKLDLNALFDIDINTAISNIKANLLEDDEILDSDIAHDLEVNDSLISINNERQLIEKQDNIFIDKFLSREYQGLNPLVSQSSVDIKKGQYGIASSYVNFST